MAAPAFVPRVKATPDQKEQFLESLRSLGGSGGNITLRANLAWDEPAYLTVKDALLQEGRIELGRGPVERSSCCPIEFSLSERISIP